MPTVIGSRPRGGSHDPICGDTLPACATLVSGIDAAVPTWPQFRGPNSTGVAAPGGNPPVSFGPSENLVWKTPLPSGHSSPCIWGDLVFLTGYYPQSASFAVFALNRHSGAVEWQREIAVDEVEKVHATSNPANATPATDGEHVRLSGRSVCSVTTSQGARCGAAGLLRPRRCSGREHHPSLPATRSAESRRQHAAAAAGHRPAWGDGLGKLSTVRKTSFAPPTPRPCAGDHTGSCTPAARLPPTPTKESCAGRCRPPLGGRAPPWWPQVSAWTNLGESRIEIPDFPSYLSAHDENGDGAIAPDEILPDHKIAQRPESEGGDIPLAWMFGG